MQPHRAVRLEKQIDNHIITYDTPTPRLEYPIASDNGNYLLSREGVAPRGYIYIVGAFAGTAHGQTGSSEKGATLSDRDG